MLNNKILLSIIIPSFNSNELLTRCLNSLNGVDFNKIEIIVVDDGSSLSQDEFIGSDWVGNIKFLKLQTNSGLSAARNMGVAEAKGEYIFFFDSDDIVKIKEFNDFVKFVSENLHLDIDLFRVGITKDNSKKTTIIKLENSEFFSSFKKYIMKVFIKRRFTTITSVTHIYRRTLLLSNKFELNIYSEDLDHFFKISNQISRIYATDFCFYVHITSRSNSITNSQTEAMLSDQKKIYKHHISKKMPKVLKFLLCSFYWCIYFKKTHQYIKGFFWRTIYISLYVFLIYAFY